MSSITLENPSSVSNSVRYLPTPQTSGAFDGAKSFVSTLINSAVNMVANNTGINPSEFTTQDLLNKQLEVQKEMMMTSMISNVNKSKHETEMAPVRNIRVG
jgi:hypothetical protein